MNDGLLLLLFLAREVRVLICNTLPVVSTLYCDWTDSCVRGIANEQKMSGIVIVLSGILIFHVTCD